MNKNLLFGLLAAVLLTACENGLDDGGEGLSPSPTGQVTNSVLVHFTSTAVHTDQTMR